MVDITAVDLPIAAPCIAVAAAAAAMKSWWTTAVADAIHTVPS